VGRARKLSPQRGHPHAHLHERAARTFTGARALNAGRIDVEEVVAEPEHVGERLVDLAGAGKLGCLT